MSSVARLELWAWLAVAPKPSGYSASDAKKERNRASLVKELGLEDGGSVNTK